ncbi:MAG TPA: O-antigen ligase family protein [Kofleriaceae bacterium]|nr:O-antigen ligase family protein [Kofleriaceae bacterium]
MFALPGIALLIIFILARPQEFIPLLQKIPFLHLGAALATIGFVVDLRLKRLQPVATNTLPWVIAFLGWAVLSIGMNVPEQLPRRGIEMLILFVLYGTLAHGIQRFRTFQAIAGVLCVTCVAIAFVCFHQGLSPRQCVGGEAVEGGVEGTPTGRLCETHLQCQMDPEREPDLAYRCEHVGLFQTYSIDNRVRYTGELHDPNEVSLTMAAGGVALLLGFSLRRRRASAHLAVGLGIALMLATIWLTKSRGGLIASMLVPGVYLLRRYGLKAVIPALMVAIPVLMLGGRSDAAAEISTQNRYEAWAAGLDMFKHSPVYGVGARMFSDHHWLTAHNSFVLTLAEMGIVGMFLFVAIIYLAMKTLIVGLSRLRNLPGTAAAQVWGMALLSAFSGIVFQINTLSFAYHSVLWLFLGLIGAWYSAIRHHMPDIDIRVRVWDFFAISGLSFGYAFVALPLYLKYKGFL